MERFDGKKLMRDLGFLGTALESGEPCVAIEGRERLTLENHGGIIYFSDRCIKLRFSQGSITVNGDGLVIDALSSGGAVISGLIRSVEYS